MRVILRMIVLLVVLAVLAVAADVAVRAVVVRQVAEGLRTAQGLAATPAVAFRGEPFLAQVVGGRYREVDVVMTDVPTSGPLVVDRLDATLYGVHAPALAVVRGELTELSVDSGHADAFVSFGALQRAANTIAGRQGLQLSLAYAAADRVGFTAKISGMLGSFTVRGQIRVTVSDGTVALRLLPDTLTGVPAVLRPVVASQVDLTGLVPEMPFGYRATQVVVQQDGLRLRAAGTSLMIPA